MHYLYLGLLIIVGLINFIPITGVASADTLARLYGIPAPQGDLLILMKHRALLFGILGALILASAFRPHLQNTAIICAFASMIGFIILALLEGTYGPEIKKVITADIIGLILLSAAIALKTLKLSSN